MPNLRKKTRELLTNELKENVVWFLSPNFILTFEIKYMFD